MTLYEVYYSFGVAIHVVYMGSEHSTGDGALDSICGNESGVDKTV